MRQIKFRAWDKNNQRMIDLGTYGALKRTLQGEAKLVFGENFHDDFIDFGIDVKDFELMQFTGLQDRNGKDIYEGDILRLESSYHKTYEVYWNDDRWGLRHGNEDYDNGDYYRGDDINNWHEFEIVGNIYANPDLLKGKRK